MTTDNTSPEPLAAPHEPAAAPPPPRRVPRWAWVAGGFAIVAAVAAGIAINASAPTPFESAKDECAPSSSDARIGDDGNTLIIDGEGKEPGYGLSFEKTACFLRALDVPDSAIARMDKTRALDGVQSAEFSGITVEWSYHPDNGFDLIFTR